MIYRSITYSSSGRQICRGLHRTKRGNHPLLIMGSQTRVSIPINFAPMLHDGDGIAETFAVAEGCDVAMSPPTGSFVTLGISNVTGGIGNDYGMRGVGENGAARVTLGVEFLSENTLEIELYVRGPNLANYAAPPAGKPIRAVYWHVPFVGGAVQIQAGTVEPQLASVLANIGQHVGIVADGYQTDNVNNFEFALSESDLMTAQGVTTP